MFDGLNPIDLVAGLHRGNQSDRDRLRRLCSGPVRLLVDRIMAHHRPEDERRAVVDLTLGWIEMDLRSRSSARFEGMPARVFLAMILAAAYRMLTPPKADGPRMPVLGADDEATLARFVAGRVTEEEGTGPSKFMLTHPDLRRCIETVRDVLDASPPISPAYTPGPAGEATIRELIGRYH